MPGTFYAPGAASMPLYQAVQQQERMEAGTDTADGVAPPGWERSIKRMKKHKDISNPYALSWWMRRNGAHPAKHEEAADPAFDASVEMARQTAKRMPLPKEYVAAAKGEVWAQSLLLDPNLPLLVVEMR